MSDSLFIAAAMYCLGKLAGKVEDKFFEKVLEGIIKEQERQQKQLDRIESKIDTGLSAYRQDAVVHLKDALQPHRTPEERVKHVEMARLAFIQARSRCRDAYVIPFLSAAIGHCWLLLGSAPDAQGYYDEARQAALKIANNAWKEAERVRNMNPMAYMLYSYPQSFAESSWFVLTNNARPGQIGTVVVFQRIAQIFGYFGKEIESIDKEVPELGMRFT